MAIAPGTYRLGPEQATLTVRTGRGGAASRAGHNLLLEVGSWSATLQAADDPAATTIRLTADSGSITVLEGTGGLQALGDAEKSSIKKTIDDDVLKRTTIEFHSTRVQTDASGGVLQVHGELELLGIRRPLTFELRAGDDGHLTGTATVKQTDWGIKPYSAMFGALKVLDEVQVALAGRLPTS